MKHHKTKALVLKNIPFKDRQCILTLLTEDRGVASMIIKGLSKNRPDLIACSNVLTEAEFIYKETKSEILTCQSASLLDPHLALRGSYSTLVAASHMTRALLLSQYPGKESAMLYSLLVSFFKQLPRYPSATEPLLASFLLKLLRHEGLLHIGSYCHVCQNSEATAIYDGQLYCSNHAPFPAQRFSQEEWKQIELMQGASSFSSLSQLTISKGLVEKVNILFTDAIKR